MAWRSGRIARSFVKHLLSVMDNFEWINRYGELFGIVYVDFKTKKRIPKISAMWYREARCNAVI